MPPVEDIGPEPLFVQFVFSVSDHQGGTVSDLLFNITIIPVDDQAPEVRGHPQGFVFDVSVLPTNGVCLVRPSPTCCGWRRGAGPS